MLFPSCYHNWWVQPWPYTCGSCLHILSLTHSIHIFNTSIMFFLHGFRHLLCTIYKSSFLGGLFPSNLRNTDVEKNNSGFTKKKSNNKLVLSVKWNKISLLNHARTNAQGILAVIYRHRRPINISIIRSYSQVHGRKAVMMQPSTCILTLPIRGGWSCTNVYQPKSHMEQGQIAVLTYT